MATLKEQILALIKEAPGLTDREITDRIKGHGHIQQPVNQACRQLETAGLVARRQRHDGLIGNYRSDSLKTVERPTSRRPRQVESESLSEDSLKRVLEKWLAHRGWTTKIAWGRTQGIDIEASRGKHRWIIEVKGQGSRPPMRVNYFIGILGELLQRMNDPRAKYSIALPDMTQFRNLWERLPRLAKERTHASVLFVDQAGKVEERT